MTECWESRTPEVKATERHYLQQGCHHLDYRHRTEWLWKCKEQDH